MCGIFGYFNMVGQDVKLKKKIILSTGYKADFSGKDSWGVGFFKNDKNNKPKFYTQKGLGLFYDYAKHKDKDVKEWAEGPSLIGHSRTASRGAVTTDNAHPFIVGNYCCIHNGCFQDIDSMGKELFHYMPKGETDSEVAFCYLMENELEKSAFENLSGWYNCVMYNYIDNKIIFFTNSARMWIMIHNNSIIFASTKEALEPIKKDIGGDIIQLKDSYTEFKIESNKLFIDKTFEIEDTFSKYRGGSYYGSNIRKYDPKTQQWYDEKDGLPSAEKKSNLEIPNQNDLPLAGER